jgi:hypothetical protein
MAQASSLFTGRAPNGPGIPLPSDLTELQRLFSAPQLRGAANRSLVPVPDYAAYEQVYKIEDAIGFPGGYDSALTMSFWFDMRKQLRVVEASWRLHPKGAAETPLPSQVVGSAEQFLDGLLALSQRNGWWNAAAQTKKKAQALSAAGA